MLAKFYDVIIVGENLAGLIAAALLAGRKYSVLLIRNMSAPGSSRYYGSSTERQKSSHPGIFELPVPSAVVRELNLSHKLKSAFKPISPLFQVLSHAHRLTAFSDRHSYLHELQREFGERVTENDLKALFANIDSFSEILDRFLTIETPFHPDGLKQRWNMSRREKELEADLAKAGNLLKELENAFAESPAGQIMAAVEGDGGRISYGFDNIFTYRRARSLFEENLYQVEGESMEDIFIERISTRNGAIIDKMQLQEFDRRKGSYFFSDTKGTYSSHNIIMATDYFVLPELLNSQKLGKYIDSKLQDIKPTHVWLKVNLLVAREVIPLGMEYFFYQLGRPDQSEGQFLSYRRDPMTGDDMDVERIEIGQPVPVEDYNAEGCRKAEKVALERAREVIPFLDDYLRKVYLDKTIEPGADDSYRHLAGKDLLYGTTREKDLLRGVSYNLPWENAYLAGPETLPELGLEGEFINAWAITRQIAQKNPRKDELR